MSIISTIIKDLSVTKLKVSDVMHPHTNIWRQCFFNLIAGNEPLIIQVQPTPDMPWSSITNNVDGMPATNWSAYSNHRIKPKQKTLVVNDKTYSYPQPFSGTLQYGKEYYTAEFIDVERRTNYTQCAADKHVAMGIVHLTSEAAREHSEVLKKIFQL